MSCILVGGAWWDSKKDGCMLFHYLAEVLDGCRVAESIFMDDALTQVRQKIDDTLERLIPAAYAESGHMPLQSSCTTVEKLNLTKTKD